MMVVVMFYFILIYLSALYNVIMLYNCCGLFFGFCQQLRVFFFLSRSEKKKISLFETIVFMIGYKIPNNIVHSISKASNNLAANKF